MERGDPLFLALLQAPGSGGKPKPARGGGDERAGRLLGIAKPAGMEGGGGAWLLQEEAAGGMGWEGCKVLSCPTTRRVSPVCC